MLIYFLLLCLLYFVNRGTQGEHKGLGATPRFALYVVRTKPLVLDLLLGCIFVIFLLFLA